MTASLFVLSFASSVCFRLLCCCARYAYACDSTPSSTSDELPSE